MEKIKKTAGLKCDEYRESGYHCAESIIRACGDAMGITIPEDVLKSTCGFSGGGGGCLESCGLLEAGIALISFIHGRVSTEGNEEGCFYLIRVYHERFRKALRSINCKELQAFNNMDCAPIFSKAAEILTGLLLEAEKIIENMPESEKSI